MSQVIVAEVDFVNVYGYSEYLEKYNAMKKVVEDLGIECQFPTPRPNEDIPEQEGAPADGDTPEQPPVPAKKGYYYHSNFDVVVNYEQYFTLALDTSGAFTIRIKARYSGEAIEKRMGRLQDAVNHMIDKLSRIDVQIPDQNPTYNQKCEVHVPGIGLLAVNRTMLLEDACTDKLDTALANGWRIIAACPQPDQRRPDYILGKYDPEWAPADTNATRNANS